MKEVMIPGFIQEIRMSDAKKAFCAEADYPGVEMRLETWPTCVGETKVAIYRPKNSEEVLPCFFFIHGGGWTTRNLQFLDDFCRLCVDNCKITVISPEYRLAPESGYPDMPQECIDCVEYIRRNHERLLVDISRMAIGGDSAGAHLTASIGVKLASEGKSYFKAQLLYYGTFDLTGAVKPANLSGTAAITDGNEKIFRPPEFGVFCKSAYVKDYDPADMYISPACAPEKILCKQPQTLLVECGKDSLSNQSKNYGKKLIESGVLVTYKRFPDGVHAILSRKTEGYEELLGLSYEFLKNVIGKRDFREGEVFVCLQK